MLDCVTVCVCVCVLNCVCVCVTVCVCAGVPTPVAQSRIQECLSQLSEADYNCIMSEYKVCVTLSAPANVSCGTHADISVCLDSH